MFGLEVIKFNKNNSKCRKYEILKRCWMLCRKYFHTTCITFRKDLNFETINGAMITK